MPAPRKPARTRAVLPEDKSERRAAILRAAVGLLKEAPQGAFSVEALARKAGLAKGTVYLYFGTREEVLLAVHAERQQLMFDVLEKALAAPKADIRMMAARGEPEQDPLLRRVEDGRHHRDVRQVGTAVVRLVQRVDVARGDIGVQPPDDVDRAVHRAEVNRHVGSVRDERTDQAGGNQKRAENSHREILPERRRKMNLNHKRGRRK